MAETPVESRPLDFDTAPAMERREAWVIALIAGSVLPLFAFHLHYLWQKPHYQFFPLLLIGIGGLVWQRWGAERPEFRIERQSGRALGRSFSLPGTAVLLLGLVVLAAGVAMFSPWVVAVATLLTAAGLILGLAEPARWRQWLPVWALLWFLIPPPMGFDQEVVTRLQLTVSRASSLMLDVFGIGHLMEGNVLVLPGNRLLVEEACSGINSLFTLLAITAVFVVGTRRPLMWSGLLLASSACWAGLTNVVRVVTVAVVQASYGWDLSSGWPHTLLGWATVGVALLMVICTDRLLAFLLGPIVPAGLAHELNPISRAWNWCVGWSRATASEWEREEDFAARDEERLRNPPPSSRNFGGRRKLRVPRWIVAGFVMAGVLHLLCMGADFLPERRMDAQRLSRPNLFRSSDLPAAVGGWKQVNYTTEDHQGSWGDFRQIWTYRSQHGDALISVAYPFNGWHDLRNCYTGAGWKMLARAERSSGSAAEEAAPYLEAQMRGPAGEYGLLLFSLVDQTGRAVDMSRRVTWRSLVAKFADNPFWNCLPKVTLPGYRATFQVQTLITSEEAPSIPRQQAIRSLFVAARQALVSAYNQQRQVGNE